MTIRLMVETDKNGELSFFGEALDFECDKDNLRIAIEDIDKRGRLLGQRMHRVFVNGPLGTAIAICYETDSEGVPTGQTFYEVWTADLSRRLCGQAFPTMERAMTAAQKEADRFAEPSPRAKPFTR